MVASLCFGRESKLLVTTEVAAKTQRSNHKFAPECLNNPAIKYSAWFADYSTSPIRYHSGSREIEHVTKIHEQIEIHLNGC